MRTGTRYSAILLLAIAGCNLGDSSYTVEPPAVAGTDKATANKTTIGGESFYYVGVD